MKNFKIILTRTKRDGLKWNEVLKKENFEVYFIPVQKYEFIKIKDLNLPENSLIVFTSTKGIEGFLKIFKSSNFEVAVLGEREENYAKKKGFKVILKADKPTGEALFKKISEVVPKERFILYPTSEAYKRENLEVLNKNGFNLKVLVLYRPVLKKISKNSLNLLKKSTDIVFFSPSQVINFFSQVNFEEVKGKRFWAIGKITYSSLEGKGNCFCLEKPTPEEFIKEIKKIDLK